MSILRFLQANINHARAGQDMLMQVLAERGYAVAVVAEPYRVPQEDRRWIADPAGSVAIVWHRAAERTPPITKLEVGPGFVAAQIGDTCVVGIYLPPSLSLAEFQLRLGRIAECVSRCAPRPVLVAGDFNAWSPRWGSRRENWRGEAVLDWAADLDLVLINTGSRSTCVRPRGESIVDLTWATPLAAGRIRRWRVVEEVDTASDHLYIEWNLLPPSQRAPGNGVLEGDTRPRRWVHRKVNPDLLIAAVLASTWPPRNIGGMGRDVEQDVEWFRGVVADACDASMPRAKFCPRRAAYWWTEEIAELRRSSVHARRAYQRARRRGDARTDERYRTFREKRNALTAAIRRSKNGAWDELVRGLDEDPWGRPYKMVLNKLRPWTPPQTESMEPRLLEEVLEVLFPPAEPLQQPPQTPRPPSPDNNEEQAEVARVTPDELRNAVKRMRARNTAPGPSGVPGKILGAVLGEMASQFGDILTRCLQTGTFPQVWKQANLVLLPKPGKPEGTPSASRPICLLDDEGKMLERVVANRVVQHLSWGAGPDLSTDQYGFRVGRSTVEAIRQVRAHTESVVSEGRVCIGVALDISNAFNTLPWEAIRRALVYHRVPGYLQRVIGSYLCDRGLRYRDKSGAPCGRQVDRGVPQGSVLGPLLWNIGFDPVLRSPMPLGCRVVAYADDTLVIASGDTWGEAIATANVAVACVVRSMEALGLKVAAHKTECVSFSDNPAGRPPGAEVLVSGARVPVGDQIKYLGLTVDGRWLFEEHFARLAPRLDRMAFALGRLLPNIGGPSEGARRLYEGVVRSVATYGAPIWAREMNASRSILRLAHRSQRRLALRVSRAYRTVSFAAATVLARTPPIEIVARNYAESFRRMAELREQGVQITPRARAVMRSHTRRSILLEWGRNLNDPNGSGRRVAEAIGPCLEEWVDRAHGRVSFRMVQVLTGHGCFGEYLHRIRRERTAQCHHCGGREDTAQHTLECCPAWAEQRRALLADLETEGLSLPEVVRAILGSESKWSSFASFCETIMSRKEEAEHVRRRENAPPSPDDDGRGANRPRRPGPQAGGRGRRRGRIPAHLRA